ncbi:MAG: SRPBCC domain-containing protein [Actinomycetota bacterium]|nr:SRPBCC domain-containing protein [Actinomycetota bacterium]MDQ6949972.1 SRPBCC domain-containing protein [Actinomycetota bacterium]
MPRTDRASRVIAAPAAGVFSALVDRDALRAWLPPRGNPRPGGSYRLVLAYADPADARGKSSAGSDIIEVHYIDIIPNVQVIQTVDFVSDNPEFAGMMMMTWAVTAADGGTRVDITADDVPDGISADDHAIGLASSLENLASYVES